MVIDVDKILIERLDKLESKIDSIGDTINELKVDQAVQEVKIGRSSAFYSSLVGMVVAILTGVIINYVSNPTEIQPKVIYKDKTPKIELEENVD